MNKALLPLALLFAIAAASCTQLDEGIDITPKTTRQRMDFDIMVTRDGQVISPERTGVMTRSGVDTSEKLATMDEDIPFGLVGIDFEHGQLVIDNMKIDSSAGGYSTYFDGFMWSGVDKMSLSAYYPYVNTVDYGDGFENYAIPYTVQETEAGPLVSKTVEKAIDQLNMVPLMFQHITNDIGYKICDITPDEALQGLIHLRKVTAYNVASAGVFVNDIVSGSGTWHKQGYYRRIVVFEGDAVVGVGSSNEKFIGYDSLVDRLSESHRYYSIPDDIVLDKQYVEVVFDIDGFTHHNFYYEPVKEQVRKFSLYGLLPDNIFVYGKQYTFHIGLDLSSVYRQITFAPEVADWETSIYENNDDF